ncbi:MAG TPA: choice-of-anchor D domain-containing protein, partial [Terriglobales bacterium]|nr:choice-of-anchor D domain-containing protein [Terriglobales bacterium]
MKDLRSRWLALALLAVSLGTLVGCATLQGDSKQYSTNNALIVVTPQLDFGTVVVGRSKTLNATLLNRTAFGVRITDATIGDPQFQIVSPAIPFSIRPGQTISLQIQYTPQSAGSANATAAVATTAPQNTANFALSAQAVSAGTLTPSASSLTFSSTTVGQSNTKAEVFTNTGSTSVTVSQLNVTGADFQVSGVTLPFTLDAGKSQSFNVVYSPKAAGTSTGSIAVNSDIAMTVSSNTRFRSRDMQ